VNKINWKDVAIPKNASIKEAINILNKTGLHIVLVVSEFDNLIGSISDGDIRRGMLRGENLESSVLNILNNKPLVVRENLPYKYVIELMNVNNIHQIPVVNHKNEIIDLCLWENITIGKKFDNLIVVMAGGRGTRLRPHTDKIPKPMVRIGEKPMLELILNKAKTEGFENFIFSINYLGNIIEDYFQYGQSFNVNIDYLRESNELGTAGSLSLLEFTPTQPIIVTNADVITDLNYADLLNFHNKFNSIATMAVRLHKYQNPYGVVTVEGMNIKRFEEKPVAITYINAGVYVLNPEAISHLHKNIYCDMPSLFDKLINLGYKTLAYPIHEFWADAGSHNDIVKLNNRKY